MLSIRSREGSYVTTGRGSFVLASRDIIKDHISSLNLNSTDPFLLGTIQPIC